MKNSIFHSKIFFLCSGIVTLIFAYLILSSCFDKFMFPSFASLFKRIMTLFSQDNILVLYLDTIGKLFICILLSFVFALFIAFVRIYNKESSEFLTPFLAFLKCSPLAVISVYVFFLFNKNIGPYIITIMVILPLICEGVFTAQEEINTQIKNELSVTDVSKFKKFIKIYLPMMSPYLVMSFLMSFGLGLKVMVMGEYIMYTPSSLGEFIYNAKSSVEIDTLLSVLILCIVFTIVFEVIAKIAYKFMKKCFYYN